MFIIVDLVLNKDNTGLPYHEIILLKYTLSLFL